MKLQYNLLNALLALLSISTVFADPNLQVSFVNADAPSSNQCTSSSLPTSSAFNVVIKNINTQNAVTIQNVTFNNHNATEGTTGTANIVGNSDNALEQKYLLQGCNGKQLQPNQTCTIPLIFNYTPVDPNLKTIALTVGAETDITQSNYTTTSFTVPNGVQNSNLALKFFNNTSHIYISTQYGYGAYMPSDAQATLVYTYASLSTPGTFSYAVTNNDSVAKTIGILCNNTSFKAYLSANPSAITQCNNISLAPGATCQSTWTIMPGQNTSAGATNTYSRSLISLGVYDMNAPAVVPAAITSADITFQYQYVP